MRNTYTDAQRQQALTIYETHGPTEAQKQTGIPKQTINSWAKSSGRRTVRTPKTRAAVEAKVADAKLRRQGILDRLLSQVEAALSELENPGSFTTMVKGAGGADIEDTLTFIPPNDRKTLIQAISTASNSAANLEKMDNDGGAEAGINMLQALAEALGVRDN